MAEPIAKPDAGSSTAASSAQANVDAPDVRAARLPADTLARHFADAQTPLTAAQAVVEAERCLYCFDAPCVTACPTGIDVPSFIRRIADGNLRGAAQAILDANPLGGMCARVCPTEELCEDVCVRNVQQGKPVEIGRLQRHAVDAVMAPGAAPMFVRAPATGRRIAVVGAGPAGIACAHGLARRGHDVVVHDARPKPGGLNEYGLAAYKTAGGFAQQELAWLLSIGGITFAHGWRFDGAASLATLRDGFDAVFLAPGLASVQRLGLPGEALAGVRNAVDFIAELRQCEDLSQLPIGRRVVVIGGGMTAIDAAVQARLLGAEEVHMVYRRGPESMSASQAEQAWAQTRGVTLHHWLAPVALIESNAMPGHVAGVRFAQQQVVRDVAGERLAPTGRIDTFAADMVFKAIGQSFDASALDGCGFALRQGRIAVDAEGATNLPGVWAGGDCRAGGPDLTVAAVEDGKRAAHAIDAALRAGVPDAHTATAAA